MRALSLVILFVIIVLGGATAFFVTGMVREMRGVSESMAGVREFVAGDDSPVSEDRTMKRFVVQPGDTAGTIADRLAEQGLVKSAVAFRLAARSEGVDQRFEAGDYELSPSMRPSEIRTVLQHGRVAFVRITIPEGNRLAQIADAVDAKRPGTRAEFVQLATSEPFLQTFLQDRPAGSSLEGYLFPDTYNVDRTTTTKKLVETMLSTFGDRVTPPVLAKARERGMNTHQLVTLASIVEREAQVPGERPTIAGVFLNRLRQGMLLQADPTVQFALRPGNEALAGGGYWKRGLTTADLGIDSPYNTYKVKGLPPGPIASPGLEAIHAVADAPPTDFLYFVARPDGSHAFARTLAEHNLNVSRAQQAGPPK